MHKLIQVWSVALIIIAATTGRALAHSDQWFDTRPTPHGGIVRMSGPYHLELVLATDGMRVYVTDHGDQKIPTRGWQAHAVALSGGQKTRVILEPAGDNTLRAAEPIRPIAGAIVVVSVRPKKGEEYGARFVLKPAPQ